MPRRPFPTNVLGARGRGGALVLALLVALVATALAPRTSTAATSRSRSSQSVRSKAKQRQAHHSRPRPKRMRKRAGTGRLRKKLRARWHHKRVVRRAAKQKKRAERRARAALRRAERARRPGWLRRTGGRVWNSRLVRGVRWLSAAISTTAGVTLTLVGDGLQTAVPLPARAWRVIRAASPLAFVAFVGHRIAAAPGFFTGWTIFSVIFSNAQTPLLVAAGVDFDDALLIRGLTGTPLDATAVLYHDHSRRKANNPDQLFFASVYQLLGEYVEFADQRRQHNRAIAERLFSGGRPLAPAFAPTQ